MPDPLSLHLSRTLKMLQPYCSTLTPFSASHLNLGRSVPETTTGAGGRLRAPADGGTGAEPVHH